MPKASQRCSNRLGSKGTDLHSPEFPRVSDGKQWESTKAEMGDGIHKTHGVKTIAIYSAFFTFMCEKVWLGKLDTA